jgi:cyclic beta-1,2-glucan synthetase
VPFLHSGPLEPHEEERYELPEISPLVEDVYHHCLRAIDHGFRFGPHGLPLIGCGDWNDGMNKVGTGGQGESVWMGWFLRVVLLRFAPIVESFGDAERASMLREQAKKLLETVEREAWDGEWYRRAYFDDGTPLGSRQNEECRIDSIAQSWSVIAGADPQRRAKAMQSLDEHLVLTDPRLALLLAPPFDKSPLNPGYIKGYLPGIRENGGQYTHAALWAILAHALEGRGTRAIELVDLINPVLKSGDAEIEERYRVEPYVVAADVYSRPPHVGRGGWTWYTGSAAWMYRVAVESILGVQLCGDHLRLAPCIPAAWPQFAMTIRRGATSWRIRVTNPDGVETGQCDITLDGQPLDGDEIPLVSDGRQHSVVAVIRGARTDSRDGGIEAVELAVQDSGNGSPQRRRQVPE